MKQLGFDASFIFLFDENLLKITPRDTPFRYSIGRLAGKWLVFATPTYLNPQSFFFLLRLQVMPILKYSHDSKRQNCDIQLHNALKTKIASNTNFEILAQFEGPKL